MAFPGANNGTMPLHPDFRHAHRRPSNILATVQLVSSSISVVALLLAMATIVVHRQYRVGTVHRLVLGLLAAHIVFQVWDMTPQYASYRWRQSEVCILGALLDGALYTVSMYECGILAVSIYTLRMRKRVTAQAEACLHLACWAIGVGVGITTGVLCFERDNRLEEEAWLHSGLWDGWTTAYQAWYALLALAFVLAVTLEVLYWRISRRWRVDIDPNVDSRVTRTVRTRLVALEQEVCASVVLPLRLFALIFLGFGAMVAIVLFVKMANSGCRRLESDRCFYLKAAANVLLDLRGLANALAYFHHRDVRVLLRPSRLRSRFGGTVRFGGTDVYSDRADPDSTSGMEASQECDSENDLLLNSPTANYNTG